MKTKTRKPRNLDAGFKLNVSYLITLDTLYWAIWYNLFENGLNVEDINEKLILNFLRDELKIHSEEFIVEQYKQLEVDEEEHDLVDSVLDKLIDEGF